jgi:hypothetical protein
MSKPQLFRDASGTLLNAASDLRFKRLALKSMPDDCLKVFFDSRGFDVCAHR